MSETIRNVIILGSGPAGYTAALYTARANLEPLLIAGNLDTKTSRIKGGQLMYTSDIENFPGGVTVPDVNAEDWENLSGDSEAKAIADLQGMSGPGLMKRMELQARHFGAEMLEEFVTAVDVNHESGVYSITTESGQTFKTHSVIIATGAASKMLGIPAEEQFFGQGGGVSTCATCDGHNYRGAEVIVVGGGDSAMEEANYLARLAKKVHLVHRREEFRASKIMLQRAEETHNIEFHLNRVVVDIMGRPHPQAEAIAFFKGKEVVDHAVLKNTQTGEISPLKVDGIFVAIGHTPNTEVFKNQIAMDDAGYLLQDGRMRALPANGSNSPIPGIFVAGDVADHVYRQAITAAGMGCQAAIEAERYLAEK
ncbi:MAG: FAD-dependent oxidoreductase [Abditibacteriaceae bacterium]